MANGILNREPTLSAYNPSWRDKIAAYMMGEGKASPEKASFVRGLLGSTGLGTQGMSVSDATPIGGILGAQEARTPQEMSLAAIGMLPGAKFINKGAGTFTIDLAGKEIGRADVALDGLGDYLTNVRISPEHQRKGLGSELYDYIESELGRQLRPSPTYQTDAAKSFWNARLRREEQR